MVMWVAVFILFIGSEYRVAPLPIAFPSEASCKNAVLKHKMFLEESKPAEASYIGRCVDMGKSA